MERKLHVLAISFPAQGHVKPLLKLSQKLSRHGIKVTFVNTEFIHAKVIAAMAEKDEEEEEIEFVAIPDGLEPEDDRKNAIKLITSFRNVMPGHLKDLIEKINQESSNGKISCIITDSNLWQKLDFATEMGIKEVAFLPNGPGTSALVLQIPKLIEQGIIDANGNALKDESIYLSEEISFRNSDLPWLFPGFPMAQKFYVECGIRFRQTVEEVSWILCNTYYELDSSACDLIPKILPIGPLISTRSGGNFWPEDSTSLSWLDRQREKSVIYVAFGSIAIFSQRQFTELALALENLGRPFLWVVRSNLVVNGSHIKFPSGFFEKVGDRGKIVEWAPQEKVLSHPSVGCFFSHCGWNSTLEGVSLGIPFLCWPYFVDQFQNQSYICDIWKIGLKLNKGKDGIISKIEIMGKIENLFLDDGMKEKAKKLKDLAGKSLDEGGSSLQNLRFFVKYLRD